jgi:amidohydrolase
MKDAILRAADGLREIITGISRELHANPELSLQEHRSSELLRRILEDAGFAVTAGTAGLPTAFVARLPGGSPAPRVALLAEYDALPGIGHGCGHNLIAAAGVGAGLVLSRAASERKGISGPGALPGELLVIGTPAEETIGGKVVMVREGVFEGIDAALMIHGGAEWRAFTDSLACVSIEVTYVGRESHAVAWPEKGINALDALIQLFVSLDMLKKRLGPEVRIPGVILEGGVRANIVPARAVGAFSLRAPSTSRRDEVRGDVERAARAIGEATGCRCEIRQSDEPYDDMVTNRALAERFREHLGAMGVATVDGPRRNRGSLDMGNVSRALPSIHPFMAVTGSDTPIHTAAFAAASVAGEAEDNLIVAVKALALTAFDALSDRDLLARAREEFVSEVAGRRGT